MSSERWKQTIRMIQYDLEYCEKQILYHQDEMHRAHIQGNREVERYHRHEQLRWEEKRRKLTRELILSEEQLKKISEEEEYHQKLEQQALAEGKSRKTW